MARIYGFWVVLTWRIIVHEGSDKFKRVRRIRVFNTFKASPLPLVSCTGIACCEVKLRFGSIRVSNLFIHPSRWLNCVFEVRELEFQLGNAPRVVS